MTIDRKIHFLALIAFLIPFSGLNQCPDDLSGPNQNTNPITIYVFDINDQLIDSIYCSQAGGSNNINCDLSNLPGDAEYLSFDDFCYYDTEGEIIFVALSIGLLSFEAFREGHVNIISWATKTELNNDYFTVERSNDVQNWQILGDVNGSGTTQQTLSYTLNDNDPYNPITYYRLKQTDFDGKYSYSKIITLSSSINSNGNFIVSLFPNPSNKFTAFIFNGSDSNTPLFIKAVSETGQIVKEWSYTSLYKGMHATLNTVDLSIGFYQLVFTQGDRKEIVKLAIIR